VCFQQQPVMQAACTLLAPLAGVGCSRFITTALHSFLEPQRFIDLVEHRLDSLGLVIVSTVITVHAMRSSTGASAVIDSSRHQAATS
jgi:hypothetical protein